ncbi:MAG: response regulator [Lachnospiraceae bacterium]
MSKTYSILIIEDEHNISNFIAKTLSRNGYKTTCAYSGQEGLSLVASVCPDIILLDLGLPDLDGITIINKIREWTATPIIVVSARIQENDKVKALDCGADDYITKPFGTAELLARIRTSIRHKNGSTAENLSFVRPYEYEGLKIDFSSHLITVDDKLIHLTPVEYKILAYLASNSGKVVTYTSIMKNVWGPYIDEDTKILRVNMANIRRKIEANPAQPKYLFTEIGVGYRMPDDTSCPSC